MIKSINGIIEDGISLNFTFSKKGDKIIMMVWPVISGIDKNAIVPIMISGSLEEIEQSLAPEALKQLLGSKQSLLNIKAYQNNIELLEKEKSEKSTQKSKPATKAKKEADAQPILLDGVKTKEEVQSELKAKADAEKAKKEAEIKTAEPVKKTAKSLDDDAPEINTPETNAPSSQNLSDEIDPFEADEALEDQDDSQEEENAPVVPKITSSWM